MPPPRSRVVVHVRCGRRVDHTARFEFVKKFVFDNGDL